MYKVYMPTKSPVINVHLCYTVHKWVKNVALQRAHYSLQTCLFEVLELSWLCKYAAMPCKAVWYKLWISFLSMDAFLSPFHVHALLFISAGILHGRQNVRTTQWFGRAEHCSHTMGAPLNSIVNLNVPPPMASCSISLYEFVASHWQQ